MLPCIVTCNASSISTVHNFGDELLRDIYRYWATEAVPQARVHHLSVNHQGVLNAESRTALERASILLYTGGGYFADGGGNRLKRHLRGLRNLSVYGTALRIARRRGIPHAVLGVEVGAIASPLYRRMVRNLLNTAATVVVRNDGSLRAAGTLSPGGESATVHLDAALAVDNSMLRSPAFDGPDRPIGIEDRDVNLALHVHELECAENGAAIARLVTAIGSHAAAGRAVRVHYIHDQRRNAGHPVGATGAETFFRRVFPDVRVHPYRNPRTTVETIDRMDLIVTTKLHVGVVARARGVPVLAIGEHPKIGRFYGAIGEAETCGSVSEFLRASIPERAVLSVRNMSRRTVSVDEDARRSALGNRDMLREVLSSIVAGVES